MKKIVALILLIFIITAAFMVYKNSDNQNNYVGYVEINGEKIFVEVAKTMEKRLQGLANRDELCENCGMIFVFEKEWFHSFWMKNTKIPLDIIFINSDLEVVDILQAEPCQEERCKSYIPKEKALYVLEVNKGMFNETIVGKKTIIKN